MAQTLTELRARVSVPEPNFGSQQGGIPFQTAAQDWRARGFQQAAQCQAQALVVASAWDEISAEEWARVPLAPMQNADLPSESAVAGA